MKKECAWCGKAFGRIDGPSHDESAITSCICDECAEHFKKNKPNRKMREYLDTLDVPIFVMNSEGRVCTANKSSLSMLKKFRSG